MKIITKGLIAVVVVVGCLASRMELFAQASNNVAVSGFTYVFSSTGAIQNPTLTLSRGVTYIFSVSAIGHPFYIKTNFSDGSGNAYNNGVVNNGTQSGILTFTVPQDAPAQLFYNCSLHSSFGMRGTLNIVNPPSPPTGEIVLITLSETGVTMKSLGAANWNAVPEFSSNLVSGVWAAVPNFTNVLANGTNTTTFDRLDAICGGNVFLRIRNQSQ